jgi:hypothetical protein
LQKTITDPNGETRNREVRGRPKQRRDGVSDDMKVNSISGITCYVKDLARTAEFYESIGFRRGKEEPGRLTMYVNWFFMIWSSCSAIPTATTSCSSRKRRRRRSRRTPSVKRPAQEDHVAR